VRDPSEGAATMRALFDGLMMRWLNEKDPEGVFASYRDHCERELLTYLLRPGAIRGKGKS